MATAQPEGYLATPTAPNGKGVLVLHAWWGLNATIRDVCDRLAEAGYVTFAPDLYHGQIADTIEGAEALGQALDAKSLQAKSQIAEAVRYLEGLVGDNADNLAVLGFSLGAYYALDLSAADPQHIRKVVTFYGSGDADFSQSRATYLAHYAGDDPYEPAENVEWVRNALADAGREVTIHIYEDTGHWFFEPDRTDAYNSAAAQLAWQRTLAFLRD
jgi:carboxymethylenebutenolidase